MEDNRRSKAIMVDCLSANPPYVIHRTVVIPKIGIGQTHEAQFIED